jgi:LuxR family maltose regulon positive regulatory protein
LANGEGIHRLAALAERLVMTPAITVACAPPGFGKSDLLRVAEAEARKDPQARIQRFDTFRHRIDPRAAADAVIRATGDDIVIVDGLRGADASALSEVLRERFPAPDAPRVWIALPDLKDLALARLTVDGAVQVIGWRSLQLADADARSRIARIPPKFRKTVGDLAKTWPAASSLLCRWAQLASAEDADWDTAAILSASGLDEYIEQEVAPLLLPEELDALVHASIAETIELGADRRGTARPHREQAIGRAGLRIAGLIERQGNRLTLHPALRQWLVARFEALPKERQVESLARAAEEFAAKGDLVVTARLLRSASMEGEIERVVLDRGSLLIWMTHGFPAIREIVDQAGEAVVAHSPVLQLMRCIVLMKTGRISEALELFAATDAEAYSRSPVLERDREIVRVCLLIYGCGAQSGDDLERLRSIVARTADEPDWKSLLATMSFILNTQSARFDAAQANLIEARVHARSAESHYNLMFLSLHEANIHLAQGELKKARIALGDGRKRWRQEFADDRGAETVMCALTSSLEYELGQLASARTSVRKSAYRMPDSEAWFDIYAAAYEPMARIIVADHGPGPAFEALADQKRKLQAQGLPRVAAMLHNFAIVLAGEIWVRDGGDPGRWEALAPIDEAATWQEQEAFRLASAYSVLRSGQADIAERLLRDGLRQSEPLRLARSSLRYRLLLAIVLLRNGDERADAELRRALLLGARLGARQVFLHNMSPQLATAMMRLAEQPAGARSGVKRFVAGLRAASHTGESGHDARLSDREIEVLRALSEGGSDKVIGRVLEMSEHGVRFHLKSIYRKLNVHDRLSAAHRARELGAI